jgi:hypothetical protein
MNYMGRNAAHHALYPNGSYTPKRVTLWAYVGERIRGAFDDLKGHWWFWTVVSIPSGYVVGHIVWWAVRQDWAMRIGQ